MIMAVFYPKLDDLIGYYGGCVYVNCLEFLEFDESIGLGNLLPCCTDYNSLTLIGTDRKLLLSRIGFF